MEHTADHVGVTGVGAYNSGLRHGQEQSRKRIAELETALTNLMQKSADHIVAGHPINSDALAALRAAERVLTNR